MASDIVRLASGFYEAEFLALCRQPANWRRHATVVCMLIGMPLIGIPLALAFTHFVVEERFNQSLLFDLVRRPAMGRLPRAAEAA